MKRPTDSELRFFAETLGEEGVDVKCTDTAKLSRKKRRELEARYAGMKCQCGLTFGPGEIPTFVDIYGGVNIAAWCIDCVLDRMERVGLPVDFH
jgi:hypothetical protein